MRVVILEDEKSAADNLKGLLAQVDASIAIDRVIDSVADAVAYFQTECSAELAFFDIHLADGNSFDVFERANVRIPVIFTTAFADYAIKAIKVSGVDYLLKPIDADELRGALSRLRSVVPQVDELANRLHALLSAVKEPLPKYRSSFLVQRREHLIPVRVSDVASVRIESGVVKVTTFDGSSFTVDEKLDAIEAGLDPHLFFRANRQVIVQRSSVESLGVYFNGKYLLNIRPAAPERIVISKARGPRLKQWLLD